MKMNPEVKPLIVAALLSGLYKQTSGRLRSSTNEFCCLGVLCNLHAEAHPEVAAKQFDPIRYLGSETALPTEVVEWAGFEKNNMPLNLGPHVTINDRLDSLAGHNDKGVSFAEIAKAIEEQL